MHIKSFKCFNKCLINRYGSKFELNKEYHIDGKISFGSIGNGYHSCKYPEDTLRYFDAFNDEIEICNAIIYGEIALYNDEYYGFYDMYSSSHIILLNILERKNIIDSVIHNKERILRLISLYKLNEEEKEMFLKLKDIDIYKAILYYQENQKDVYQKIR